MIQNRIDTQVIPQKRVCWKCKREYDLTRDNFYRDSKDKHGFQKRCKSCNAVFSKQYSAANQGYFERKNRENYALKISTDPDYNKNRYHYAKDDFKRRKKERYETVEGRLYELMKVAEGRSLRKSAPFDLTLEFLIAQYEAQGGKCLLTGIPFELKKEREHLRNCLYYPFSPSIDQIEPSRGYLQTNVRLICTAMNLALNQWKEETFELLAIGYIRTNIKTHLIASDPEGR